MSERTTHRAEAASRVAAASRPRGWPPNVVALATLTLLFAGGAGLAQADVGAPPAAAADAADLADAADVGALEEALAAERARREALERRVVELVSELGTVRRDRDRLKGVLDSMLTQYAQIDADRQLLVELRKDLPETRDEAEAYLDRVRTLALAADPARLAPLTTRVMQTAPTYLDWRHTAYPSPELRQRAFADTGAHGFPAALLNLRNAVLLSVSNRMDGFLNLLDRVP